MAMVFILRFQPHTPTSKMRRSSPHGERRILSYLRSYPACRTFLAFSRGII
jgi:hypothetical protein